MSAEVAFAPDLADEITYRVLPDGRVELSHEDCSVCGCVLPIGDFYWNGDHRASACKRCQIKRTGLRIAKRGMCSSCGGPKFAPDRPGECRDCYQANAPRRRRQRELEQAARAYQAQQRREERREIAHRVRAPLLARLERAGNLKSLAKSAYWAQLRSVAAERRAAARIAALDAARRNPVLLLDSDVQERIYQVVQAATDNSISQEIAGEVLLMLLNGDLVQQATRRILRSEFNLRDLPLDAPLRRADGDEAPRETADTNSAYIEVEDARG